MKKLPAALLAALLLSVPTFSFAQDASAQSGTPQEVPSMMSPDSTLPKGLESCFNY
jgi:hypothetical protein